MLRSLAVASAFAVALFGLTSCSGSSGPKASKQSIPASSASTTTVDPPAAKTTVGPPTTVVSHDIYAADRPNALSAIVKNDPPRIYVPNSLSNTVDVIDPATAQVIDHFAVGDLPQHVVPSWDLKTLYVTNDRSNSLTPIDPVTGRHGALIPVEDPYNMYFTPDGKYAMVVAERLARLDFRDPHTFQLVKSVHVNCVGIDHVDFSADGRYLIASCEFSGQLVKLDVATQTVVGVIPLHGGNSKPQDVKLDPTGRVFYVADMIRGGVYTVDGDNFTVTGFVPTGAGAHGLYVSRDSKVLYVTNRNAGTISLIDFATGAVARTWVIPGGGSPDMGGVSTDGKVLWVSGRYNGVVYAIDTTTGALLHKIRVGSGPHGLSVFPQPGRYSLGHTGVFR
ncbi:MAG TPA: YncE family protein [Acidimicrobiia bacterium]|jgi:YVTN family beta-propeller protein|nr:YncE family protein [Acidimicrobiia bacterium]